MCVQMCDEGRSTVGHLKKRYILVKTILASGPAYEECRDRFLLCDRAVSGTLTEM